MEHGDSKAQVKGGRSLSAIRANTGFGPMEQVWRFLVFLGLCFMLFILGLVKGSIVGLPSALIIFAGHMAVVIGLWPVHVFCTYRTLAMTKKLGIVVKVLSLLLVPIPLLLWPCVVVICSLLGGLGYGFGQPLVATFEAVGENRNAKFHHSLTDGTYNTLKGSCTVVRDFTDFTFHSYFDLIDEFRTGELKGAKPFDIKLVEIPGCILVGLLGLIVDTPIISLVALAKSPLMLLKGWRQLILDLVGQPSSCVACVPFAGLAIVLWPLVVCAAVLSAIFCSPFLGLFGAVIVYQYVSRRCLPLDGGDLGIRSVSSVKEVKHNIQENSFRLGLSHVVAVVAEFDEYSNDVLDLNGGSCLPSLWTARPRYRRSTMESKRSGVVSKPDIESGTRETVPRESFSRPEGPQLNTQRSLKQTLQEVKLVQMWDHFFRNLDSGGKVLIDAGVLRPSDLEKFIKNSRNPNIKWVAVGVPAYCTLQGLLASAKSGTVGFLLRDGLEVTPLNRPKERFSDWFFEPLLTIRDQLRAANLQVSEDCYLEKLVLTVGNTARMNEWDNGAVEPDDGMRKAELQALARRLQGIATSISRLPTHRRRFEALVKTLLAYAKDRSSRIQRDDMGQVSWTESDTLGSDRKDSLQSGSPELSSHLVRDDVM